MAIGVALIGVITVALVDAFIAVIITTNALETAVYNQVRAGAAPFRDNWRFGKSLRRRESAARARRISALLPNLTPELDRLLALFFVALLLYLIPAAFGLGSSPEHRRRFEPAAIVTLGTSSQIWVRRPTI
jgi:hypothetical protein